MPEHPVSSTPPCRSLVTHDGKRWSNAATDVIAIVAYDADWPRLFTEEVAQLQAQLPQNGIGSWHHFGSTAVPGLAAKPILDILLIHDRLEMWPSLIAPITALNYVYWAQNPDQDRLFFVKGMPPYGQYRTHHLHVRRSGDAQRELRFRDRLRANRALAQQYAQLKQRLAQQFRTDRDAYTQAKSDFINRVFADKSYNSETVRVH